MDGSLSQSFCADVEVSGTAGALHASGDRIAEIAAQARTGIDPVTGLATDFLNQFNEVAMMLDMLAADPSLIEDIERWEARDYATHFAGSGFTDCHLILEAYALSPSLTRRRFEQMYRDLVDTLANGLAFIANCRAAGATGALPPTARALGREVREHLDRLNTLIHAGRHRPLQTTVDAMFARPHSDTAPHPYPSAAH